MKSALIFGVTGLTGKAVLHTLIKDERYSKIYIVTRRPSGFIHPNVEEILFNYQNFLDLPNTRVHHIFSCLGTTLKKAGSKAAQQIIDKDYPISIAKYANEIDAEKLVTISSVGADAKSGNFYLRTKGEMEIGVQKYFNGALFVRPSFLFGDREELRIGEKIGVYIFKLVNPFLIGGLKKYKGIHVKLLAKAMINACFNENSAILHYKELIALAKQKK